MRILKALIFFIFIGTSSYAQLNTEKTMTIGRIALSYKDYVLSIQYFNQIIKAKPYLAEPWYFRAIAKFYLEDFMGALEDCDSTLSRNPFYVDAYSLRGACWLNIDRPQEAREDFEKGLKFVPEHVNMINNRGLSYLFEQKYDEAISDLTEAYRLDNTRKGAIRARGQAYVNRGDTLLGLKDYSLAIKMDPYDDKSYLIRGNLQMQLKNYAAAESDFNSALILSPDDPLTYENRGIARYFNKLYDAALSDLNRSLALDPNRKNAYFNRGLIRMEIGDWNKAAEDFTMVLNFEAENYFAFYNRGLIYMELGQYYDALDDFDRVLTRYPEFTKAYYARSNVKEKLGDEAGATRDLHLAFLIEEKKGERKKGDKKLPPGASYASAVHKSQRKESDQNIRNFKSIVVIDEGREREKTEFENEIRGQIQNRNISIDLERLFTLSTERDSKFAEGQTDYFSRLLDAYNRTSDNKELFIQNDNLALSQPEIDGYFKEIDRLTQRIGLLSNDKNLYFKRAMLYDQVKDFNASLQDLNRTIELDANFILAYFYRATVRFKMVEFVLSLQNNSEMEQGSGLLLADKQSAKQNMEGERRILDYDLIMHDLSIVLSANPEFAFAYYNRGFVRCILKDYHAAVNDFTLAISIEPDMAEAYFNRGLTYIYLGDELKGSKDLSKAGELGLYNAYNILKRFGLRNK